MRLEILSLDFPSPVNGRVGPMPMLFRPRVGFSDFPQLPFAYQPGWQKLTNLIDSNVEAGAIIPQIFRGKTLNSKHPN